MNKKVGVYLTGGGAKGSYQIGSFKAFEEFDIKPDVVFGASAGAIIGGASTYLDSYEMLQCFKELTLERVLKVDSNKIVGLEGEDRKKKLVRELTLSCFREKLIDIEDIRKLLYWLLDGEKIKSSDRDFGITTTLLPSFKRLDIFKEDMKDNPLEYILASLYLPIFSRKKIINNKSYLDIASYRNPSLEVLKDKNCSDIYIFDISSTKSKRVESVSRRVFDKDDNVSIIKMKSDASFLDFTEEQIVKNYKMGYEDTCRVLSKRK